MSRGGSMQNRERRQAVLASNASLRAQLNDQQRLTLQELEHFGWELKFVRRPPFMEAIPVVLDRSRKRFAVIRADGSLDSNPGFHIR